MASGWRLAAGRPVIVAGSAVLPVAGHAHGQGPGGGNDHDRQRLAGQHRFATQAVDDRVVVAGPAHGGGEQVDHRGQCPFGQVAGDGNGLQDSACSSVRFAAGSTGGFVRHRSQDGFPVPLAVFSAWFSSRSPYADGRRDTIHVADQPVPDYMIRQSKNAGSP